MRVRVRPIYIMRPLCPNSYLCSTVCGIFTLATHLLTQSPLACPQPCGNWKSQCVLYALSDPKPLSQSGSGSTGRLRRHFFPRLMDPFINFSPSLYILGKFTARIFFVNLLFTKAIFFCSVPSWDSVMLLVAGTAAPIASCPFRNDNS